MSCVEIKYVPPDGEVIVKDGGFLTLVYGENERGERVVTHKYWRPPSVFFYWKSLNEKAEAEWRRKQAETTIATLPKGKLRKA